MFTNYEVAKMQQRISNWKNGKKFTKKLLLEYIKHEEAAEPQFKDAAEIEKYTKLFNQI